MPNTITKILYHFSNDEEFLNFKKMIDEKSNLYYIYYKLPLQCKTVFKKRLEKCAGIIREKRIKIISDVDDTFVCSGGMFGNIDDRYPRDAIYPGVTSFYKELAPDEDPPRRYGNLIFISARPEVTRQQVNARFMEYFKEGILHTVPMVLFGNFLDFRGVPVKNYSKIAEKKFKNFQKYAKLYPEYNFVFVGDNGQGDVLAGDLMLKSKYSDRIKAVFIHKVDSNKTQDPTWVAGRQIHYFSSYIEAATKAYHLNLIDRAALKRIFTKATDDFEHIPWEMTDQKISAAIPFTASSNEAKQLLIGFQELDTSESTQRSQSIIDCTDECSSSLNG